MHFARISQQHSSHLLPMTSLQFYKYTAPADGVVIPWACSDGFNATLSVDDGTGDQNCIGPFNGCDDPQISNPDSQTTCVCAAIWGTGWAAGWLGGCHRGQVEACPYVDPSAHILVCCAAAFASPRARCCTSRSPALMSTTTGPSPSTSSLRCLEHLRPWPRIWATMPWLLPLATPPASPAPTTPAATVVPTVRTWCVSGVLSYLICSRALTFVLS